ncbi:hypothetical protein BH10PAT3_BH10PAT3_5100 [soil metagenome]
MTAPLIASAGEIGTAVSLGLVIILPIVLIGVLGYFVLKIIRELSGKNKTPAAKKDMLKRLFIIIGAVAVLYAVTQVIRVAGSR